MNTFAFNMTFTRPDENNANEYTVGFNVEAETLAEAQEKVGDRNDHLTIMSIWLFAIMNEDGDVLWMQGE